MLSLLLAAAVARASLPANPPSGAGVPTANATLGQPSPKILKTLRETNQGYQENKGQWHPRAKYRLEAKGVTAWITKTGLAYAFQKPSANPLSSGGEGRVRGVPESLPHRGRAGWGRPEEFLKPELLRTLSPPGGRGQGEVGLRQQVMDGHAMNNGGRTISASTTYNPPPTTSHLVEVEFLYGNLSHLTPKNLKPGVAHFGAKKGRKAATDVRRFGEVWAKDVWKNIDARLYQEEGRPRYDFLIHPGGRVENIRLKFKGAENLKVQKDGRLTYQTPAGPVEERALKADQNGKPIEVRHEVRGNGVGFRVGKYDPKKTLRIDPVVWSRYVGGSVYDGIASISALPDGSALIAGITGSSDLESKINDLNIGEPWDSYISRISADGRQTMWSRYIGGTGYDSLYAIALLPDGSSLAAGVTTSPDLENQANIYSPGGDGFVMRLSADGRQIIWSRYVGGTQEDWLTSIALLPDGSPVVAGRTRSLDIERKSNDFKGGTFDGYVARVSSDGSQTIWSRYVGGIGNDMLYSVSLRSDGSPVVAGGTTSNDFEGAINSYAGGSWEEDGVVSRLSIDGQMTVWSRYVGGTYGGRLQSLALLPDGSPVVGGYASSGLENSTNERAGWWHGSISRLSSNGLQTLWSRYTGDVVHCLAILPDGSTVVAGSVSASNLENPVNQYKGDLDGFVAQVSSDGHRTTWSQYVGGASGELLEAIALLPGGSAVVAGRTYSSDLENRTNERKPGGQYMDGFVVRLSDPIRDDVAGTAIPYHRLLVGLQGADGESLAWMTGAGIVCDNLASTDPKDRNHLKLPLKPEWAGARAWGFVQEWIIGSDGIARWTTVSESRGGKLFQEGDALHYEPPLEYDPAGTDKSTRRTVRFRVHVEKNGQRHTLNAADCPSVYLARTPTVLVHGINNTPDVWKALPENFKYRPWLAIDHSDIQKGNGPVEHAAARLNSAISTALSRLRNGMFDEKRTYWSVGPLGVKFDPFDYTFSSYKNLKLSAKRVDIVAWSYGGLISRWYLASDGHQPSLNWYKRAESPNWDFGYKWPDRKSWLRDEQEVEKVAYDGDVRKLVTLGTMWRGVPTCNWVNEILEIGGKQDPALGEAPCSKPAGGNQLHNNVYDPGPSLFPDGWIPRTRVASQEVMAIDSPWLRWLIYRNPLGTTNSPTPCVDGIAYHAIAGDDNMYPIGPTKADTHLLFDYLDKDKWFPWLQLEVRREPLNGKTFSDGIVPLWSQQLTSESTTIVPTTHNGYPWDPNVRKLIVSKLDSPGLTMGVVINDAWRQPGFSLDSNPRKSGQKHKWQFSPINMAPAPQNSFYKQIDGVGRIFAGRVNAQSRIEAKSEVGKIVYKFPLDLMWTKIEIWEITMTENGPRHKVVKTLVPSSNLTGWERTRTNKISTTTYARVYWESKSGSAIEQSVSYDTASWVRAAR